MIFHHVAEFVGQSDLLESERGLVSLVFIALQQQVEQPVVRVRRAGLGQVDQVAGLRVRVADDPDLGGEFIAGHRELGHAGVWIGREGRRPLAGGVVPKDQAVSLEDPLEAIVDSFHEYFGRRFLDGCP